MNAQRSGFSLVEVMVALVILSIGVLAMGASTGYIMTQIRASELRTERMTAVRQTAETLRSTPWTSLEGTCGNEGFTVGAFIVKCTVLQPQANLKRVELVSTGPGYREGRLMAVVPDTFAISIAQPVN